MHYGIEAKKRRAQRIDAKLMEGPQAHEEVDESSILAHKAVWVEQAAPKSLRRA
jgi:hypothetical protein